MCVADVSVYGDTSQKATKPNVLFIAIDDLNDWTGMLEGMLRPVLLIWTRSPQKALFLRMPTVQPHVVVLHDLPL